MVESLAPGIYFGLPDEDYHTDPALSRSNILDLLDTPRTYWENSPLNPNYARKRHNDEMSRKRKAVMDPLDYGKAFHRLLFEPREFERLYQVVPIDEWSDSKIKITQEDYYSIVESIKVLRKSENSNMFLTGGVSEVTIVFDDNGIRHRTRHDYLGPACTVDFKTARALDEWIIKHEFSKYGYDVQLALYKRSRVRFKEQFAAGEAHVYGKVDKQFFEAFMAEEMNEFLFIFQRKTPPHPFLAVMPEDDTEDTGLAKIERAVQVYQANMKKYGSQPWPVCDGRVRPFSMHYGFRSEN